MDFKKMIAAVLAESVKDHKDVKVSKSFPMKKEWTKEWDEIKAEADKQEKGMQKLRNRKKKLWLDIEFSLDIHGRHLRINEKDKEIELMEEKQNKDEE